MLGTESETDRDGVLSAYAEWHALILGIEAGIRAVDRQVLGREDVRAERHYFAAGFVLGWLLRRYL